MIAYPKARQGADTREFFGSAVPDPFRWMEGPASAELGDWLGAQTDITARYLEAVPRNALHDLLADIPAQVPDIVSEVRGNTRFYLDAAPGEDAVLALYVREGDNDPELLIHPEDIAPGAGQRLHKLMISVSPSGRYVVFGLGASGADAAERRIYDRAAGRCLAWRLPMAMESQISWYSDDSGFFYGLVRAPFGLASDVPDGVYFHRIGTRLEDDRLIHTHVGQSSQAVFPYLTPDNRYLCLFPYNYVTRRCGLSVIDLGGEPGAAHVVFGEGTARLVVAGYSAGALYLSTTLDAPNGRIIAVDLEEPRLGVWRGVVAEAGDAIAGNTYHEIVSSMAMLAGERLAVAYIHDAASRLRVFDLEGGPLGDIPLPPFSTIVGGRVLGADSIEVALTGFLEPHGIYRFDLAAGGVSRTCGFGRPPSLPPLAVEQHFARSANGPVPYFLVSPQGARTPPTILYGYGGFGQSITPFFSSDAALWLRLGGAYAVANVRGGGEYGEAWHRAGAGIDKRSSVEDFCAVARDLVATGRARRETLAIRGVSCGGLLVAAACVHAPELFGAVVAEVPLTDVLGLRDMTYGDYLVDEYGDPRESLEAFAVLRAFSPQQNIVPGGRYPPLVVVPAECDERVSASVAYKFVAAMQAAAPSGVALLRLIEGEGHGDWPAATQRAVVVDEIAFLIAAMGLSPKRNAAGCLTL